MPNAQGNPQLGSATLFTSNIVAFVFTSSFLGGFLIGIGQPKQACWRIQLVDAPRVKGLNSVACVSFARIAANVLSLCVQSKHAIPRNARFCGDWTTVERVVASPRLALYSASERTPQVLPNFGFLPSNVRYCCALKVISSAFTSL